MPDDIIEIAQSNSWALDARRTTRPTPFDLDGGGLVDFDFEKFPAPLGPSLFVLLDLPLVDEEAEVPHLMVAASGTANHDWPAGAEVYRAEDVQGFVRHADARTAARIGYAKTKLASGSTTIVDETNTLTVRLDNDLFRMPAEAETLVSITDTDLLNGKNLAALGNEIKGWEIIAFRDAEQVEGAADPDVWADSWQLSTLLRGLYGTEHMVDQHDFGDRFVMLDDAPVRVAMRDSDIDVERWWKVVTRGLRLSNAVERPLTYVGRNTMAMAPARVSGARVDRQ